MSSSSLRSSTLCLQVLLLGTQVYGYTTNNRASNTLASQQQVPYPGYEYPPWGRCGVEWVDANSGCDMDFCFDNSHCKAGESCFRDLDNSQCLVNPNPLPPFEEHTAPKRPDVSGKTDRKLAYLASWTCIGEAENDPACDTELLESYPDMILDVMDYTDVDAYLLAFSAWSEIGGEFKIISSDQHLEIPNYDRTNIPRAYNTWTNLKYEHNTTMLVSLGGDNFHTIWGDSLSTPANRVKIAKALVDLLETPFPVYQKNAHPEQIGSNCRSYNPDGSCAIHNFQEVGKVFLDGFDFDLEKPLSDFGESSITEELQLNVLDLVDKIKSDPRFESNKHIMGLTTIHVGADPLDCRYMDIPEQCSYWENGGSPHTGEAITILENGKDKFDFFNVMAYDAGRNLNYLKTLENTAQRVGDKEKVVLGLSKISQWSPTGRFTQTEAENRIRAAAQKREGYGGFFLWTLGYNEQGLYLEQQIEYFKGLGNAL